jgi:hypothetical protein
LDNSIAGIENFHFRFEKDRCSKKTIEIIVFILYNYFSF